MKNTVLISSFLGRGQRWQLVALVALFFAAGCTVELYPPAQEVSNLPDGGKVDVLPDTIPRAFAFGPRMYWSQIVGSDSTYSFAVTGANKTGRWLDSIRWVPSGPFVTVNGDTLSTRAYARDNSGVTGDDQVLTYNGGGSLSIEDGNTVDMSDLLDNTDDQTIDTLTLQGDTMLQVSLSGDGAPVKELDLSALRSVVDSTRLTQDSILVYYQDGVEIGRDTIGVTDDNQVLTYNGSGSLAIEDGNTVDMSDLLDNTDDQTIDTLSLSGTTLSLSLESDGQAAQTVDLSALAVIDSTRLAQDSILVYYQDGIEVGRDTISGIGGGGGGASQLSDLSDVNTSTPTNRNVLVADGVDWESRALVEADISDLAHTITDSTRLIQDSILVYYQGGAEIGRDTVSVAGGGGGGGGVSGSGTTGRLAKWSASTTLTDALVSDNGTNVTLLGGLIPKNWTTAGRPTGVTSLMGYNTSFGRPEFHNGTSWQPVAHDMVSLSAGATTTAKSIYTMTSGQNVEFRRSGGASILFLDEANGRVGIGTNSPANNMQIVDATAGIPQQLNIINNTAASRASFTVENNVGKRFFMQVGGSDYAAAALRNVVAIAAEGNPDLFMINTHWKATGGTAPLHIATGGYSNTPAIYIPAGNPGNVGIGGITSPSAKLHLPAGTATANTAPLKFTAGANLTTPEAGAMEWDGTNLYITQTTGPTRKTIAYVDTDDGSASDTTDGSGDITVSHTLGSASITVTATATGTTFYHVQVHTKTSTTFKIRFFDAAGAAVTATAVTADWIAKLQ